MAHYQPLRPGVFLHLGLAGLDSKEPASFEQNHHWLSSDCCNRKREYRRVCTDYSYATISTGYSHSFSDQMASSITRIGEN